MRATLSRETPVSVTGWPRKFTCVAAALPTVSLNGARLRSAGVCAKVADPTRTYPLKLVQERQFLTAEVDHGFNRIDIGESVFYSEQVLEDTAVFGQEFRRVQIGFEFQ